MRIRLWMVVLGVGVAFAVAMWIKNRRATGDPGWTTTSEGEGFEGAAAIRRSVVAEDEGFEGAAAIRRSVVAEDEGFEGAAAIRREPAEALGSAAAGEEPAE